MDKIGDWENMIDWGEGPVPEPRRKSASEDWGNTSPQNENIEVEPVVEDNEESFFGTLVFPLEGDDNDPLLVSWSGPKVKAYFSKKELLALLGIVRDVEFIGIREEYEGSMVSIEFILRDEADVFNYD